MWCDCATPPPSQHSWLIRVSTLCRHMRTGGQHEHSRCSTNFETPNEVVHDPFRREPPGIVRSFGGHTYRQVSKAVLKTWRPLTAELRTESVIAVLGKSLVGAVSRRISLCHSKTHYLLKKKKYIYIYIRTNICTFELDIIWTLTRHYLNINWTISERSRNIIWTTLSQGTHVIHYWKNS